MGIVIRDTAYHLPKTALTNEQLGRQHPEWDMSGVEDRAGVLTRHIAAEDETALDLAAAASAELLAAHDGLADRLGAVIFCTQTPDYIMPPNACILHKLLALPQNVMAFDFNLACSGYVYGLAIARGLIMSGAATDVLLVNADTYSKLVHQCDRSSSVLFGDGAAASWICRSAQTEGILDIQCATSGEEYKRFYVPAGGCRMPKSSQTSRAIVDKSNNVRTLEHIHMDGLGILSFVNSRIPVQIKELLERNRLGIADIDLFIFHQASKIALDSLARLLGIPAEKVLVNVANVGNTVSASIPIALTDARNSGRCKPGDKAVLCGFGVGLSWATALYQF